jgi:hypothetical protein
MSPRTGAVGLPPTESDETAGNYRCWRTAAVHCGDLHGRNLPIANGLSWALSVKFSSGAAACTRYLGHPLENSPPGRSRPRGPRNRERRRCDRISARCAEAQDRSHGDSGPDRTPRGRASPANAQRVGFGHPMTPLPGSAKPFLASYEEARALASMNRLGSKGGSAPRVSVVDELIAAVAERRWREQRQRRAVSLRHQRLRVGGRTLSTLK